MSTQTPNELSPIDAAAKHAGGFSALARSIGVTTSAPHMWKSRGVVPSEHCAAIEKATAGAVRRWDLRPDDWHRIWPELLGSDGAPEVPAPAEASAEQAGG